MTNQQFPNPPAQDTPAYRKALGSFATGVCVVTADGPQGPTGITVNSFASVSLEPRLVLWCLDERSERVPTFLNAQQFAIHVLSADDMDVAKRFARGDAVLKPGEFIRSDLGLPCLKRSLARFECALHERIVLGDHIVLVGRVEQFDGSDGMALTYFRSRFGLAAEPED